MNLVLELCSTETILFLSFLLRFTRLMLLMAFASIYLDSVYSRLESLKMNVAQVTIGLLPVKSTGSI